MDPNSPSKRLAVLALLGVLAFPRQAQAGSCGAAYVPVCAACAAKTIQGAVNAVPGGALAGNYCIDITDNRVYDEQVTVVNKNPNNFQIVIGTDTGAGRPIINPPAGSTAAFQVANSSVTLLNINIVSTNAAVGYGILTSSDLVTISSVNIDGGTRLNKVGMEIFSNYNSVSYSSISVQTSNGAIEIIGATNTISRSFIYNSLADALVMTSAFSSNNVVSFSTITAVLGGSWAANFNSDSYDTVTQSYISNITGFSVVFSGGNNNTVSLSTVVCDNSARGAVNFSGGSSITISQSFIQNRSGDAIDLFYVNFFGDMPHFSLTQSTVIGSGGYGLYIASSTFATVSNSYVEGSTPVFVTASTGTVISGSTLVGTSASGAALWMAQGSVGLTVSKDTFTAGAQGQGIYWEAGSQGTISIASSNFSGGRWGINISTMNCGGACTGANLSISTVTFAGGLTAGATAINFGGGTFVSTFSNVSFTDANIAVNVNGASLASASRITMLNYSGAKGGPGFEHDPNSLIDWVTAAANSPPTTPAASVMITSITVTFGGVGADSYSVQTSTASDFSGNISSAGSFAAVPLAITGLTANTTYFIRAGAVWGPATFYANTSPASAVTQAAPPIPLTFTNIQNTQFTVNWPANGNPAGTVYQADVSTDINFGTISASQSTSQLSSTFTALTALVIYYIHVRAFNGAGTPSAAALGAVQTSSNLITISANLLTGVWSKTASAVFCAQGPSVTKFHYKITPGPSAPAPTDPSFDGSCQTFPLPQGANDFNVLGTANNDALVIGTTFYGPVQVDTGTPTIASVSGQTSATDTTPILTGGSTLATAPRFFWPAASSLSPIVGYSLTLSTDPAVTPGQSITTTITFSDQVLSKSGTYYAKVSALNLAGTLGPPASMSFNFSSVPSVDNIVLKNNYFNAYRSCAAVDVLISRAGHLKAQIYTLLGQRVVSLNDSDVQAGTYSFPWCGKNDSNQVVATGVYILHIEAPGQKKDLKLIVAQ